MPLSLRATAVMLAAVFLLGGDTDVAGLKKDIAAHPEAVEPNVRLVDLLLHEERFDEADEAVQTALKANAQASDLHRIHGDLLFREGHVPEADAEYKAAFHLDKQNPRALYGIARTFRIAGLNGKAASLIRAAHELAPTDPVISSAYFSLDNSVGRWERMALDPAVTTDPAAKSFVQTELAKAKVLNGRHEFELASPYQPYQLPYRVLYNGKRATGMGLTIVIKGVKSELLVDTGAGGLLVSSSFAAKAGIQRIGGSKIGGLGNAGDADAWVGYADSMRVGNIEFRNIIVKVKEKGSVGESDGLIGTDIFKRFLVDVNIYQGRIDLDPLPGPAWDGFTPVDRYEGRELAQFTQIFEAGHLLLIPTLVSEKLQSEQTNCLFLIDTGAEFNDISTNLAPGVTKVRSNHSMAVSGVSGRVKMVYQADRVVLQFGSFRQTNLGLTSLDETRPSRAAGLEVSGTLGLPVLSMFQSFTIDYRDAKINFDYKPR
jgi:Flp pilus assembly protein TadD/predicted aspartyl protease